MRRSFDAARRATEHPRPADSAAFVIEGQLTRARSADDRGAFVAYLVLRPLVGMVVGARLMATKMGSRGRCGLPPWLGRTGHTPPSEESDSGDSSQPSEQCRDCFRDLSALADSPSALRGGARSKVRAMPGMGRARSAKEAAANQRRQRGQARGSTGPHGG